ncbi:3-methyl-2-oxobutanoate dehydrogenase subunit VorB [Candidatus Eisenbacteria bacterium]|uniref:3-methyl-2-oxobutanoate dehydrogenase subunit VorB n=1 Tax=Eiseniibacteriota bacterium TaxID=2212470 RepID=A0ABV6YN54_UNCEI
MAEERKLMKGNEAIAEAAIRAGCRFYAGYPITPQNELTEYMSLNMPDAGGVFVQAESEVAAINMVYGASATGARVMTSSSGPGISLKQEGISYLCGAELPAFYANIVRGGPGLGNIAPAQSDYFQSVKGGGHGDYRVIVLAPSTGQELVDLTRLGFDLADKYRNPAMILGDGILGQMMEPVVLPDPVTYDISTKNDWSLANSSGRDRHMITSVHLAPGTLEKHNIDLLKKYRKIEEKEVRYEAVGVEDADVVIVAYGTAARVAKSAVAMSKAAGGLKLGLIRPITLWPFPKKFISEVAGDGSKDFLVVEMSLGQMHEDVLLSVLGKAKVSLLGRTGGGVPEEEEILEAARKARASKEAIEVYPSGN